MPTLDKIRVCPGCGRKFQTYAGTMCTPCYRLRTAAELCVRVASPHDVFTASDFTTEPCPNV
jgi:hypothetical protein